MFSGGASRNPTVRKYINGRLQILKSPGKLTCIHSGNFTGAFQFEARILLKNNKYD